MNDAGTLWQSTVAHLASAKSFEGNLAELLLAMLVSSYPGAVADDDGLNRVVGETLDERWRLHRHTNEHADRYPDIGYAISEFLWLLSELGLADMRKVDGDYHRSVLLTDAGRVAAVTALRERAQTAIGQGAAAHDAGR